MSSITIDRVDGLSSSTAVKGPARVATTADISLSGLQTVDGVALAVNDRVLVKDQTDGRADGLYVVDTGPWRRAKDFSSNRDIRKGTQVWVTEGENGPANYVVTSDDPIAIGATALTFSLAASQISIFGTGTDLATLALAQAYVPAIAPLYLTIKGYYAPGDGGGATYKKVVSEPAHAGKFSITTILGTTVWYEIAEQVLNERMFGAPCDGSKTNDAAGTDAKTFLQNWLNCTVSKVKRFTGISRVTDGLAMPAGIHLLGLGPDTGINAAGGLATTYEVLKREASLIALPDLSGNVSKGAMSIALTSTSAVVEGDFLHLVNPTPSSWSTWRSDYSAGEVVQVLRKSGSTLYGTNPLYDSYTAANIDVSKFDVVAGAPVRLENFWIKTPADRDAILIRNVINPVVKGVHASGSKTALIVLDTCVRIDVDAVADGAYDAAFDNDYGLSINSCQWGMVRGFYTAGRHAIANGAYAQKIPNRALLVICPALGNGASTSFDAGHAGSEDLTVMGGTHTSLGTGGKNIRYVSCRIRQGTDGIAVYGGEHIAGDFSFNDCDIESFVDPTGGGFGIIQIGNLTAHTTGKCRFFFNNCRYRVPATCTYLIRMDLDGVLDANAPEIYINGGHVNGAGLTHFLRVQRYSGGNTIGAVQVTGLQGLPAGCAPVLNAGAALTVNKYILDDQIGTTTITPASTSVAEASKNISFPRPYPIAPTVIIPAARSKTMGGKRVILSVAAGPTGAAFNMEAVSADGSNFASTADGDVSWLARW